MFGIDGPEFLVILLVLIVVVGPKDLPQMMRSFGKFVARMRTTANEFRQQFDDAMREADLDEVRKTLSEVADLDPRKKLTRVFDPFRDVAKDMRSSLTIPDSADKAKGLSPDITGESKSVSLIDGDIFTPNVTFDSAIEPEKPRPAKWANKNADRNKVRKKIHIVQSTPGGVVVSKKSAYARGRLSAKIKNRKTDK